MVDTYQPDGGNDRSTPPVNDCYSAEEVAKILGIKKEAVLKRCRGGKFAGAYKAEPTATVPAGQWFIPRASIDRSTATQEVIVLPQAMTPEAMTLAIRQAINQGIAAEMAAVVEPLTAEIKAMRTEIADLKEQLAEKEKALPAPTSEEKKSWWKKLFA